MAIWHIHDALSVGIDDGVIRAADFAQLKQAEELLRLAEDARALMLDRARREAATIIEDAQASARRLLDQAQLRLDGAYQAGLDRGLQEAAARWAGRALEIADNHRHSLVRQSERLSNLVTMAVERLIDEEDRASLFRRSLRTITKLVKDVPLLTMHVHESDREQARQAVAAVLPQLNKALSIEVVANEAVPRGTCRFESDEGVVEASLDTQIAALRQAVQRAALDMLQDEQG